VGERDLVDQRTHERRRVRALSFAERLLRRWRIERLSVTPLGLIFRRARPARVEPVSIAVTHLGGRVVLDLRPRIDLTVVRPVATSSDETPGSATTVLRETRERLVLRRATARPVEKLVERVLARAVRVESTALSTPRPRTSSFPAGPARPSTALVVRQELVREQRGMDRDRGAHRSAADAQAALTQVTLPEPLAALPLLDVEALTDRVVASIDRRIVVEAERTGRV
jgi:hypothetical protein